MKKALLCGIASSFFFAATFLLNRSMNLSGGSWLWGACLRYFWTLPLMAIVIVLRRQPFRPVFSAIHAHPGAWLLWSTVGFGLFYSGVSLGSVYGQSWLVAASWQLTIVCGVLLTPLFGKRIPTKNLCAGFVIIIGVFCMQCQSGGTMHLKEILWTILPILVATFAYPLGNRTMMSRYGDNLDTFQRIFGMTLCSIPFWIGIALVGGITYGPPSGGQLLQTLLVALFSGTIATSLFFHGTELVKDNPGQLALIEATQCGEVVFTLLGGVFLLHDSLPTAVSFVGIGLVILGMVVNSLLAAHAPTSPPPQEKGVSSS